ncbi:MAG: radical SAM protein [Patescibacteria group bacterium]
MEQSYRTSDFLHLVEMDPRTLAAYNALTFGVLFLRRDVGEILKTAVGGIFVPSQLPLDELEKVALITALEERRLIFPIGERADLKDYMKMQDLLRSQGLSILYLMLADGCNMACKYCYVERPTNRERPVRLMSDTIADTALEKFSAVFSPEIEEPQVILYGGEPLLNRATLYHVLQRIKQMKISGLFPDRLGITLNTNGTLIDDEFAECVKEYGVQVSISLDGPKSVHDPMRPYIGGKGSFDDVERACTILRQKGVDFGFSITIHGGNVARLDEILLWVHETFGMMSIGFNILVDREERLMGMSEEAYAETVTKQLIRCFEICREKGIYEDRIMRKVNAFVRGYPYINDCGAPGDQMVVTPDGFVGVCQAYCASKKYFVPLDEFTHPSNHPIWKTWRFRSPLYQRQCYNCIALGLCGGGCPYNADLKQGTIWGIDETFCVHAKGTLEYLLKDLHAKATT